MTCIRGNDFDANVFTPRRRDALHDALARSALVCCVSGDKAARIAALHPVMVEAAALGRPLLASRSGGMADWLADGETALLFEPGAGNAIASPGVAR